MTGRHKQEKEGKKERKKEGKKEGKKERKKEGKKEGKKERKKKCAIAANMCGMKKKFETMNGKQVEL